jgi:hypothetical protein
VLISSIGSDMIDGNHHPRDRPVKLQQGFPQILMTRERSVDVHVG